MYLIRTILYGFNYYLGAFMGKEKEFAVWEGLTINAKKFDNEKDAEKYAYDNSTLECEIIKVTYE